MTKKDYELIAQGLYIAKPSRSVIPYHIEIATLEIRNAYCAGTANAWDNTCRTLAEALELKDKDFKKSLFLQQCGVSD